MPFILRVLLVNFDQATRVVVNLLIELDCLLQRIYFLDIARCPTVAPSNLIEVTATTVR